MPWHGVACHIVPYHLSCCVLQPQLTLTDDDFFFHPEAHDDLESMASSRFSDGSMESRHMDDFDQAVKGIGNIWSLRQPGVTSGRYGNRKCLQNNFSV